MKFITCHFAADHLEIDHKTATARAKEAGLESRKGRNNGREYNARELFCAILTPEGGSFPALRNEEIASRIKLNVANEEKIRANFFPREMVRLVFRTAIRSCVAVVAGERGVNLANEVLEQWRKVPEEIRGVLELPAVAAPARIAMPPAEVAQKVIRAKVIPPKRRKAKQTVSK